MEIIRWHFEVEEKEEKTVGRYRECAIIDRTSLRWAGYMANATCKRVVRSGDSAPQRIKSRHGRNTGLLSRNLDDHYTWEIPALRHSHARSTTMSHLLHQGFYDLLSLVTWPTHHHSDAPPLKRKVAKNAISGPTRFVCVSSFLSCCC